MGLVCPVCTNCCEMSRLQICLSQLYRCRDMDKKIKNTPKRVFPHFFEKSGFVNFVPLWCPNFLQKIRKTNEQTLRYLKTDGHNDKGQITKDPFGQTQGPKSNYQQFMHKFLKNHMDMLHAKFQAISTNIVASYIFLSNFLRFLSKLTTKIFYFASYILRK